jgi:hypothetical protein
MSHVTEQDMIRCLRTGDTERVKDLLRTCSVGDILNFGISLGLEAAADSEFARLVGRIRAAATEADREFPAPGPHGEPAGSQEPAARRQLRAVR